MGPGEGRDQEKGGPIVGGTRFPGKGPQSGADQHQEEAAGRGEPEGTVGDSRYAPDLSWAGSEFPFPWIFSI